MIPTSLPEISEHQFGFGAKILHQKFLNPNLVLVLSFFARNTLNINLVLVPNFLARNFSTPIWFLLLNKFLWQMREPHGSWLMRWKIRS
jgi:hypothetical protein